MKRLASIVLIVVLSTFFVRWILPQFSPGQDTGPIQSELSERSQEFIAERKAEQEPLWRGARLDSADAPTNFIENNSCFRVSIEQIVQLPRTEEDAESCTFQGTITEPHARLLISYQPSTRELSEETGIIFRRSNPDYEELTPPDSTLLPPAVFDAVRFESNNEHLTMLRTSTSLITISVSQISRNSEQTSLLVDDILSTLQFNR